MNLQVEMQTVSNSRQVTAQVFWQETWEEQNWVLGLGLHPIKTGKTEMKGFRTPPASGGALE